MHLLDQYGADAVRYWSLSAKLGVDTAFDEKVLKVGRRLVTKLFNVGKFVLAQTGPAAPITRDLDLGFLHRLRETVDEVSAAFEDFEYATALDLSERFFWNAFTDAYVEMVKARARSESDAEGRGSAVAALRLTLGVVLRLYAPFLPYITEDVWSWGFAEVGSGGVHRALWPGPGDFAQLPVIGDARDVFETGAICLDAVHRAKSAAGASVGRHLSRLRVAASPRGASLLARAQEDVAAAARVESLIIEERDGLEDAALEVLECRLAEERPS